MTMRPQATITTTFLTQTSGNLCFGSLFYFYGYGQSVVLERA